MPLCLCAFVASPAAAQNRIWNNPAGGAWETPANWTPNDEPDTNTESAIITAAGPFAVTLGANRTILDLDFSSADSILALSGSLLTMEGSHTQQGSTISGAAGSAVSVLGLATLRNATLLDLSSFSAAGDLLFDGPGDTSILNTTVTHAGTTGTWQGGGNLIFGGGAGPSGLSLGAASVFIITNDQSATWDNTGVRPEITNAGILDKNGGVGLSNFVGVSFNNTGTVRASTGTLRFDTVANISAGTLTGGTWRVENDATLDLAGQNITTNQGTIELNGANSAFGAIDALETNGVSGTLRLLAGRGFIAQGSFANLGLVDLGAAGSLRITPGNTFTSVGGTISGVSVTSVLVTEGSSVLQGGTLSGITYMSTGDLRITGSDPLVCDDTCFDHSGLGMDWEGTGGINVGGGSDFSFGPASIVTFSNQQSMVWDNTGMRPTLLNSGTLVRDAAGTTTSINGVEVSNMGTIRVQSGTLLTDRVQNADTGVLSTGTWEVMNNATLDFGAQSITTSTASVILDGPNSTFDAINALVTNDTGGRLDVRNGRNFTTAGDFTNNGAVGVVGETGPSTFKVASGSELTNYDPAARRLSGGAFQIRGSGRDSGTVEIDGLDIAALEGFVSLDGPGANIIDPTAGGDQNALRNLDLVGNAGMIEVTNGKNFDTLADLSVALSGQLAVGADSTFNVNGDLTNFDAGGVFSDGVFTVGGTLRSDNALIVTLANTLTLDADSRIQRPDGAGGFIDAVSSMERVAAAGRLTLRNGHMLTLLPHDLNSDAGSIITLGPPAAEPGDTFLHVQGDFIHAGALTLRDGELRVDGDFINNGMIAGSGTIQLASELLLINNGVIEPGESPGLLRLVGQGDLLMTDAALIRIEIAGLVAGVGHDQLWIDGQLLFQDELAGRLEVTVDPAFTPLVGQRFEILRFEEGFEGWFETLEISQIFRQIREEDRFILEVIPTPGTAAVVGIGALLGSRRRRRRATGR